MDDYTQNLSGAMFDMEYGDDTSMEDLLEFAKRFRHFDDALSVFLREKGFAGDMSDTSSKTQFIKERFAQAGMEPPRDIAKWFDEHQMIKRNTAYQLCFAFRLNIAETQDFFRRVFAMERCFDCHSMQEAVYYFCVRNHLSWQEAQAILQALPKASPQKLELTADDVLYTGSILAELERLESKDELIDYLTKNEGSFAYHNATAYRSIAALWKEITCANGLLVQEWEQLPLDTEAFTQNKSKPQIKQGKSVKLWDAYLGIMGLDKQSVKQLGGDRTIRAILTLLPDALQNSFPDRQSIDSILRGEPTAYETVRKLLILLVFYEYWVFLALERRSYDAIHTDAQRFLATVNDYLTEAGYMALYEGNPYDWVILYTAYDKTPLMLFRMIWQELLADQMDALANPNAENRVL